MTSKGPFQPKAFYDSVIPAPKKVTFIPAVEMEFKTWLYFCSARHCGWASGHCSASNLPQ